MYLQKLIGALYCTKQWYIINEQIKKDAIIILAVQNANQSTKKSLTAG